MANLQVQDIFNDTLYKNRELEANLSYNFCPQPFSDSPELVGYRGNRVLANSSPIHAATPQSSQLPIITMEDEETSDQEMVSGFHFFLKLH